MTNRLWVQADPLRFRVSPPGVDVLTSEAFDNIIDERLGAVSSIWGSVSIPRQTMSQLLVPLPFVTTVYFGKTFPKPPMFVFIIQDIEHTGWISNLRPIWHNIAGEYQWSQFVHVYTDRAEFHNYNRGVIIWNFPSDLVYWRAML